MNNVFNQFKKEIVKVDLVGKSDFRGTLIESNDEIIVLFDGDDFVYIPMNHVDNISVVQDEMDTIQRPSILPTYLNGNDEKVLTFDEMLNLAKGFYTEIYFANRQPIHGIIYNVMSDYFIFHSPIYKTLYISKQHLKWFIPFLDQQRPFDLTDKELKNRSKTTFEASFERQIEKMKNKLVVFNLGEQSHHIGKLVNMNNKMIEIRTARGNTILLNLEHIKSMHEV
ncbi:DUF2642 domain-containing protein [Lysinibacillus endophyticus]|uniref:DUF2642 domain-containing protein n=1 Tax=Ureibacillus endophyticus TaxID=1978490 RepID=A0A494Z7F2_9BACL|nr:DUF2642 domain-containing protein [Lysinibacillus endophyticus]RKQ18512.1 DUF2642 domain-containing protein [Lysinibacillus endophyticus]